MTPRDRLIALAQQKNREYAEFAGRYDAGDRSARLPMLEALAAFDAAMVFATSLGKQRDPTE